jgi:hypothetical protein
MDIYVHTGPQRCGILTPPPVEGNTNSELAADAVDLLILSAMLRIVPESSSPTMMSARSSVGEMKHCVFIFKMAVDPPQGDQETTSGLAESENAPSRCPLKLMP